MTIQSLDQLFGLTASLWKTCYPDLCFTARDRSGALIIRFDDQVVSKIRFSLPKYECLHLAAIKLIASRPGSRRSNNTLAIADGAIELSSTLPGTESLLELGWSNGSEVPWITFHTCEEENPSATLTLSSAVSLSRLEIENRSDEYAFRAWGLKVETCGPDGEWKSLYDASARGEAFMATLLAAYRHYPEEIPLQCELHLTARLLRLMLVGDLRGLENELHEEQRVSHENKVFIQKNLSRLFLEQTGLEWTRHGIARTFRYWSLPQKVDHISDSMEIVRDLHGLTKDVSLGYGAVLSFVRDRDLMPHDDDIDIIVALPKEGFGTISNALRQVESFLRSRGYNVIGTYPTHRQVGRPGKKDCDVFVGLTEGQFVSWLPGERGALNVRDVFPAMEARFLGVNCAFPKNPFVYLETVYGPTWATPLPGWSHDWDPADYLDILSDDTQASGAAS